MECPHVSPTLSFKPQDQPRKVQKLCTAVSKITSARGIRPSSAKITGCGQNRHCTADVCCLQTHSDFNDCITRDNLSFLFLIFCKIQQNIVSSRSFTADCGKPALPPGILPIPDNVNTLEGSVITLQCEDDDDVPEGDAMLKCGSDGRWSISNFYCRRKLFYTFIHR